MKKLFLTFFIGFSLFSCVTQAWSREYCTTDDLLVDVMNLGADNCVLVDQRVLDGSFFRSNAPLLLTADAQRYYFTLTGVGKIDAELTYQCGYKKATLKVLQYRKSRHKHTSIEFQLLNAADIFASYEDRVTNSIRYYHECYYTGHSYPGKLSIRLTH